MLFKNVVVLSGILSCFLLTGCDQSGDDASSGTQATNQEQQVSEVASDHSAPAAKPAKSPGNTPSAAAPQAAPTTAASLTVLFELDRKAPDGNGTITQISNLRFNDNGQVAIAAKLHDATTNWKSKSGRIVNDAIFLVEPDSLTELARTGDTDPSSNETLLALELLGFNNNGQVLFRGGTQGGGGLFTHSGDALQKRINGIEPAPDPKANLRVGAASGVALDDNNVITCIAELSNSLIKREGRGIFTVNSNNEIHALARKQKIVQGAEFFSLSSQELQQSTNGITTFYGAVKQGEDVTEGIWKVTQDSLSPILLEGQAAPDGNGNFSTSSIAYVLNDNGSTCLKTRLTQTALGPKDAHAIVFINGDASSVVARTSQPSPDGNGTFSALLGMNSSNTRVALFAQLRGTKNNYEDDTCLFAADLNNPTSLKPLIREGDPSPDGVGVMVGTNPAYAVSNAGDVLVSLTLVHDGVNQKAVFIFLNNGTVHKIIREGDMLAGKEVVQFSEGVFNNKGQILFSYKTKKIPGTPRAQGLALYSPPKYTD